MKPESLSSVASKLQETKKLEQKLIALEIDYKIFQDSKKGLRSRRFSIEGPIPIIPLFEKSPRTLMSSLQNKISPIESNKKAKIGFKGRSLFDDFENAVEVCGPFDDDDDIEDRGSEKQGICDGSCSGSCLSEEKLEEWMGEKVEKEECRKGFLFNGLVVMVLLGIILVLVYMMSYGVYGDEEVILLPT